MLKIAYHKRFTGLNNVVRPVSRFEREPPVFRSCVPVSSNMAKGRTNVPFFDMACNFRRDYRGTPLSKDNWME